MRPEDPCPDCGSLNRVLVRAEGDTVCTNCGVVLDESYLDDQAPFSEDRYCWGGDGRCIGTIIGGRGPAAISLARTQARATSTSGVHAAVVPSWKQDALSTLKISLSRLTNGIAADALTDLVWNVFVTFVEKSPSCSRPRMLEATLTACTVFALKDPSIVGNGTFGHKRVRVAFNVGEVDYSNAKGAVADALKDTRFKSLVITGDHVATELRDLVGKLKFIPAEYSGAVRILAKRVYEQRIQRDVCPGKKPELILRAIVKLVCDALGLDTTSMPNRSATVKSNETLIQEHILEKWPGGLDDWRMLVSSSMPSSAMPSSAMPLKKKMRLG